MDKKLTYSAVLASVIIFLFLIPLSGADDHPYHGCYLRGTNRTTTKIIMSCDFYGTDYTEFPEGHWLAAVPSVAGGDGGSPNAYVFQGGIHLYYDGDVLYAPQYYYKSVQKYLESIPAGDADCFYWFSKIERIANNRVRFKCYLYEDDYDCEHDAPVIISRTKTLDTSDNTNLLVGRVEFNNHYYRYYQVGVEASTTITSTNWKVETRRIAYYDSSEGWYYIPGYVTDHDNSRLTYWVVGQTVHTNFVGDIDYDVDMEYETADHVDWEYDGTQISDDSVLWTESGTPDMTLSTPFS